MLLGSELVKNICSLEFFPEQGMTLTKPTLKNGIIPRVNPSWFAVCPATIATKTQRICNR
jgi:hypothetical protein